MEIVVNNKVTLKNPPEDLVSILTEKLKFVNPNWTSANDSGRNTYGIDPYIYNFIITTNNDIIIPRGVFSWVCDISKTMGINYNIIDERIKFNHIQINSSAIKYRPYQFEAVSNLTSTSTEGVLVSPAGSGKTVMGLSLIPLLGQPTIWLTHTGPLVKQAYERAENFLPDIGKIGVIGAGKWEIGDILTIGMVQTLVRNPERVFKELSNKFGMMIVDEAHRTPSRTFLEVTSQFNSFYMYGLTATPYRRDRLEDLMFQALGEDKTVVKFSDVIKFGGIVVPSVKRVSVNLEKIEGNNIQKILKNYIVNNTKRNYMIVNDVINEAKNGHYCIVISDRKAHCEILYKLLLNKWKKTGIATGSYNKKYVDEQVKLFNNKDITILITTSALLGEGFDVPFLDRAFLAMPFRAEGKCEQVIGRIQRTYPGKKDAILYDYVDDGVGVLKNQYYSKYNDCRYKVYKRIGSKII